MKADIKLTWKTNGTGTSHYSLTIPVELSRPMHERGYNRARISITDDGILLTPYVAPDNGVVAVTDLPDWGVE